ncbi:MAG: fibronectin type III domain-containing protein [Desulfuromonadales bacterium]|nr:fibronectin type III domain-containing protein [Desulfuromonadales bacterium]
MKEIFPAAVVLLALLLPFPSAAREIPTGDLAAPNGCPISIELGTPQGVQVVAVPEGLRISWPPLPKGAVPLEGYQVVRTIELEGPWQSIAVVGESVTDMIDTTATMETIYYYRVRSFGGGVCGRYSIPARGQR